MEQDTSLSSANVSATNKIFKIKKILYATDLSQDAPKVFQYVLSIARQFGAEVISLHVIERYSEDVKITLAKYFSKEKEKEMMDNNYQETMNEMLFRDKMASGYGETVEEWEDQTHLGVKSINKVVYGNIEEQILMWSDKINPDLIILGAHKKSFTHTYWNTVGKRVLKRSKVPVTIVPICD